MKKYAGHKLIVYVGAIHRLRGCLNMIKAMKYVRAEVPNAKLLLIGQITDPEFLCEIEQLLIEEGLKECVEFLGVVPYPKLHTYLSICDIALWLYLPYAQSLRTMGSSKLFLYMRAGLPIIASNLPGIKLLLKNINCSILVDPTNVEQIASAIVELLRKPKLARQLGENGRRAVAERFNWEFEEKEILRAYASITRAGA